LTEIGPGTAIAAFVVVVLIVISKEDLERRLIPNRIVLPAWGIVFLANTAAYPGRWLEWLASSVAAASFFLVFAIVSPTGLGMGDVKLAGFLGAALGRDVVTAILLGTIAAAVLGITVLVRRGLSARKTTIPLGPFLAAGAIAVLLFF
jgi:leader peptidase (prepilin peptidase) / N-methyltransferase